MNEQPKELNMTRVVNAPRELAWKAWTDQDLIKQWWGPSGVTIPVCEVDPKVGGKMNIVMEAGEAMGNFKGTQWPMEGTFEELDEPSKIVFTANAITNGKVVLEHRTTVTFTEEDGKTSVHVHVVVTKVLPGSEFAIAGMEQGWNEQFNKMAAFLEEQAG